MATIAQLETYIQEAESRRHEVATGGAVIDVWRDGRRMRLHVSSIEDLDAYIERLKGELAEAQVAAGIKPKRRRRALPLVWRN